MNSYKESDSIVFVVNVIQKCPQRVKDVVGMESYV